MIDAGATALFFLGALGAPVLMRRGRLGFIFLAGIPGIALLWFLMELPGAFRGEVYAAKVAWLPQLGFTFDVRIDALSLIMALLVTGVGTLVLLYSARYFSSSAAHLGRFAGVFLAFAGAMLGLVTTDSTPALYLFWELTTVFFFLADWPLFRSHQFTACRATGHHCHHRGWSGDAGRHCDTWRNARWILLVL